MLIGALGFCASSLNAGIKIPTKEIITPNYITEADLKIIAKSKHKKALAEGEKIYKQICFTCHGQKLEGAVGPSLKDGEWLHGSKPSDLVRNIAKGFSDKGMMAMETMYSKEQIESVAAYVLSHSSGMKDLAYEVRPGAGGLEKGLTQPAFKKGVLPKQLIQFDMMESDEAAVISYTGKMYFANNVNFGLLVTANSDFRITMANDILLESLNGKGADFNDKTRRACEGGWYPIRIDYLYRGKDSKFTATMSPRKQDKFELSADSKKLKTPPYFETIEEMPRVVRFDYKNLPPRSMAVGVPKGEYYALLNATNGGLYSVWKGKDFVESSGQRNGRAGSPAIIGDPQVFSSEKGVYLWDAKNEKNLDYKGYDVGENVVFRYEHEGVEINITPQLKGAQFGLDIEFSAALKSPLVLNLGESKIKVSGGSVNQRAVQLPKGHSNTLKLSL